MRVAVAQDDKSVEFVGKLGGFFFTETAHAADERGRAADREMDEIPLVCARVNDHAGFNGCEHGAFVLRNAKLRVNDGIGAQSGIDGGEERLDTLAGKRRHGRYRAITFWTGVGARQQSRALIFREQVDLIQDFDAGLGKRFELAEDFFDLGFLFFAIAR